MKAQNVLQQFAQHSMLSIFYEHLLDNPTSN